MPVTGTFYLYNLKEKRLVYQDPAKLEPATTQEAHIAPFYVDFKEAPEPGLYDLAVRGSGHRSESPLWVSDTVYWDALAPVIQNLTESHCPSEAGHYRVLQQCFFLNADNPYAPRHAGGCRG